MRDVIRYSKAFKRRLVEDMGNGKYQNLNEARRRNGIRGGSTLSRWLKQYGREDMLPKRIKVETMNELDELKAAWCQRGVRAWCQTCSVSGVGSAAWCQTRGVSAVSAAWCQTRGVSAVSAAWCQQRGARRAVSARGQTRGVRRRGVSVVSAAWCQTCGVSGEVSDTTLTPRRV
ncbi:MAG: transposase [Treponema sp.]|jgi:hypothetical protein|nr:transposase [Treponema sp.]